MDNKVVLSKQEAEVVLCHLGDLTVTDLCNNIHLMNAINKLNMFRDHKIKWSLTGSKVELIKAVRTLSGWGLKESKDFVDARTPGYIEPTYKIIIEPFELGVPSMDEMYVRSQISEYIEFVVL